MRVLNCIMVCDSAEHTGGISAVMLSQARGLQEAGVGVFVFAAFGPVDPGLRACTVQVACMHPARTRRNHLSEIWNPAAAHALERFLEPFNAADSVVHIHSISMGLSPAIADALRSKKIPYVITAHDASWACPTGYFYNMQTHEYCNLAPLSLACLCSHCDKRGYINKAYKVAKTLALDHGSRLKRDAAAIIAPSHLLRQRLLGRVPSTTPVRTLLNPVDAEDHGVRNETGDAFLFVGRLWEEKGIVELLEAIGDRYPLVVVGDGPLKDRLAMQFPKVIFKGWLSPAQVALEMRKAIALVLPSIYLEAFGLVVAEALSQGVPAIVSHRAGASTLIRQGHNGYVIDMARPDQLIDACSALMDKPHAAALSANAYATYWERPLSTGEYIQGLMDLFDSIDPVPQSGPPSHGLTTNN